ncbi:diacylglycerol O-acyltransferase 1 [Entomophthora muscae]|uniref:Diacylglycerol O-acyltransferase 1 n=1 Tax=Entomophthora muscae TaxID=34485 RepID=A0ACC2RVX4_9FUNG|nr:diacylglycerol O-acyltransferase 1 [Entomophthora muscae]
MKNNTTVKQPKSKGPFADLPKVEFAPVIVPLARRRQTFATYIYATLIWHVLALFFFLCTFPFLWPFIIAYLGYIVIDKTPENGGRVSRWFQSIFLWKWLAEFFPASLQVEQPLDASKTYIFGYHPHGILSTGAFINFGTQATGLSEKLPGLNLKVLTLNSNFLVPLYRELLLFLGMASVSKESILNILSKGPGNGCVIVVGGAQESLSAKPELVDLVLAKRYGFVKLAIQTGSSLVPVFAFGEKFHL